MQWRSAEEFFRYRCMHVDACRILFGLCSSRIYRKSDVSISFHWIITVCIIALERILVLVLNGRKHPYLDSPNKKSLSDSQDLRYRKSCWIQNWCGDANVVDISWHLRPVKYLINFFQSNVNAKDGIQFWRWWESSQKLTENHRSSGGRGTAEKNDFLSRFSKDSPGTKLNCSDQ